MLWGLSLRSHTGPQVFNIAGCLYYEVSRSQESRRGNPVGGVLRGGSMKIAWFHRESTSNTPAEPIGERLSKIETDLRLLRTEWEDTYERVMRALRRLNKRAQDLAAKEEREAETREVAPESAIPGMPSLDPISAAIIARRNRAVPPRPNGGG